MTTESTASLVKKYQQELETAVKRYNKTMGFIDNPPNVPVGQTPKEVIWTRNKAKLYHYIPTAPRRYREPLLFIYSLMNKAYIVDLRPGSSLVEFLLNQGHDIYLLDWGIPGPEDADMKLDDYVLDYMPRAVKQTLKHAQADELTLVGYCLGGVLSVCYTSIFTDAPVKNLVILAIPLDFSEQQLFNEWLNPRHFNLNVMLEAYGNVPGEFLNYGQRLKDPVPGFITSYTGFFDKVLDDRAVESWISMQQWMNDVVPFAGGAFKQFSEEMWLKNKLINNELVLRGHRVVLSNIKMSLINILANSDQIVLNSQSDKLLDVVGSEDKEQVVMPGGHVGLAVGRVAAKGLWPTLDKWLRSRSTEM